MKSISQSLMYVVESMVYDYVDYKVDLLIPTASTIYYGRCFKTPDQTYGIIDVTEIIMNYCNHNEIFNSTTYLYGNTSYIDKPVLRYNISIKQPNSQLYLTLWEGEEVFNSWLNNYYNIVPTQDNIPNVLQHKREYFANINTPIAYDVIRKYYDTYSNVKVYYRPDGNNALLYSQNVSKDYINHFLYKDYFNTNPTYVEVWTTTTTGGVETELPNSRIRYDYVSNVCKSNEFVIYWLNRYGGLEYKVVDGKTVKTSSTEKINFESNERLNVAGASVVKNSIAFKNSNQQNSIINKYALSFNYNMTDDEVNYMETLFSSPMVWLYDLTELQFIPVIVKDTDFNFNYYRLNKRALPAYTINVETSIPNIRR